ncbi:MAG: hypothetical protein AAGE52_36920 [Myxococcota bacterium]
MARQVVVSLDGATSTFDISKVDRSKLYGRRLRVNLDPDGEKCTRAALTEDGSVMVKSGMTSQGYFDADGLWYPNKELVGVDKEGNEVDKVDSTLGAEQELTGPVDPERVLDLRLISVYQLDPSEMDDALEDSLADGDVYEFPFNYRADFQAETAFLIANEDGEVFALIGRMTEPKWHDPEEMVPTFEGGDDDDDDDLDFEMF